MTDSTQVLNEGDRAPDFSLLGSDGAVHTLTENKGKWLLLYFYPKDNTPGCTVEAEVLRDAYSALTKSGAVIYGVSTDSVASHKKFCDKLSLPFVLLADTDQVMVNAYGVWGLKKFMGREYMGTNRDSFLIAPDGTIAKVYRGVKPKDHAAEVLADISALQ